MTQVKRSIAALLLAALAVLPGFGCKSTATTQANVVAAQAKPITLEYWGVFTDTDDMDVLIKGFQANHANIRINYRKFRPEEYEQKLLEAFAEDRGPDLFTVHNNNLGHYLTKLAPMPANIPFFVFMKQGSGLSEKVVVTQDTRPGLTLKQLRDKFVGVVESDVLAFATPTSTQKSIFALPFFVDSLALYYNHDLLAQNQITKPAADWEDLLTQAQKYTKPADVDERSKGITQAIVPFGTGTNVHRASDLLVTLMMQNGSAVTAPNGRVSFNSKVVNKDGSEQIPGVDALGYYLDFADPKQAAYTWNTEQGDALDAFAQGRVPYYFGYSYDASTIQARNPRLNFDINPILTPRDSTTKAVTANYWIEAVSKKSRNINEAWLFISEAATNKDPLAAFLKRTKRASALNELIQTQLEDPDVGVFAKQALTSRSWYHGKDGAAVDAIMTTMIEKAHNVILTPAENQDTAKLLEAAVGQAATQINDTL